MIAPARFSVIEVAHKGIRNVLSQLSLLAGATDFTSRDEIVLLKTRSAEAIAMLEEHAHVEETLILPLLEGKVPAGVIHDQEDHAAIHQKQESLLHQLDQLLASGLPPAEAAAAGRIFYQDLSQVHAAHLQHMLEEERGSQVLIWQHYSDDELRQLQGKILQSLDPTLKLTWMRYILPALNRTERQRMLNIQQATASEQYWHQLQALLREVVPETGLEYV